MNTEMERLPRGRHSLTRDEVEASQRLRLLRGMAEALAEKGYVRTTVADVLRRARVSRETFYQLFSSKEDCFMAAFEDAYAHIGGAAAAGLAGGEDPARRLSRVLDDYLGALASNPAAARVFLIEVYAAGPSAIARRLELQRGLIEVMAELLGAESEEDRWAVEALVAAIVQMVTTRLALGDVAGLSALRGPILALAERLDLATGADAGADPA